MVAAARAERKTAYCMLIVFGCECLGNVGVKKDEENYNISKAVIVNAKSARMRQKQQETSDL